MEEITDRQRQLLDIIGKFMENRGYPPTLREMAAGLGISGTVGVLRHLEALERKGFIRKTPGSSRGIVIAGRPSRVIMIPVVGTIRAGSPQPAVEDIEGWQCVDPEWAQGDGCFFLRVKGESMRDAHILDGDLAMIRPQNMAENGEIVAAMIDGDATLKRFFRDRNGIRLQPENSEFEPITVKAGKAEAAIIGKLVGIVRRMA